MLKIIETFSGIGSQVQALKNIGIPHEVKAIVEWEVGAMYAYDIIHNGPQDISKYRHHTKDSLINELSKYNISNNGKEPITERGLNSMSPLFLKSILEAIDRNNNLVDITQVKAKELPDADVLTYSFPCQDLSVSGHWHNNEGGINRDANNRSTLLWQIERLLKEYIELDKEPPKFLLMENVSNILSSKHIDNFNEWCAFLEGLGYYNQVYTLDARNFGIPQNRIRTYMVSVLCDTQTKFDEVSSYFFFNSLESIKLSPENMVGLENYLKLDYSNNIYREEAIDSTPSFTESRKKIYENNVILAEGSQVKPFEYARTITTKQDRNPNSGIIAYGDEKLVPNNKYYRNLTPRECFLLMGFKENDFDRLMAHNINVGEKRKILPTSKLVKIAGNSIVVNVLEAIFTQINDINEAILKA